MRKAQAALEFLSTYGWMMIALSVGVFAAFSLGLFENPANRLPDTCTFIEAFQCSDSRIRPDGTLELNLKNVVGNQITIDKINCVYQQVSVDNEIAGGLLVNPGETGAVSCTLTNVPAGMKDKIKINVNVLYREAGKLLTKSASGSVMLTMSTS